MSTPLFSFFLAQKHMEWLPLFLGRGKLFFYLKSKLQVLSFMFVLNFRRYPLPLKLMTFVLNV
ncbi:hypothetical protein Hanom_Chr10g00888691 [Helianthus anomalus]